MAVFYDTHAHLDHSDFAKDLAEVVERAQTAGIAKLICIGTDLESSRRAVRLAEQFACVYAVVGWHPSEAPRAPADIRGELRELARHKKVVALGETGLDYHHLPSENPGATVVEVERYKWKQGDLFRQHLEVGAELGLNCVIHQRDSLDATLAQFQPFAGQVRGVFHCFANDTAAMKRILALNSLVSFTGIATFKNAQTVRDTIAATPPGQFMLETDSPYLAPEPYRGKRCEPAYVNEIANVVAEVKGISLDELGTSTCYAAHQFFRGIE
jgi:TatD DNase family protein